jgi:integrase
MASIQKRRGRYMVNYRDALGRQRQPSFRTRREAEQFLATVLQSRQQRVTPAVDPEIKVEPYSVRWLTLVTPTLKPSTVGNYSQRLRVHIVPAFGPIKVRQLQRGQIKTLLAEKLASGLAVDSVRLIHATIRAMLNAAVDDGVILANPANKLGKILRLVRSKSARQEEIKALDRAQVTVFLATTLETTPRLYPLFLTLARTGLRIGEALALQWSDLDFKGREIRVQRAVTNDGTIGTPKSGHGRTVDMSTSLRDVLQRHQAKLAAAWLEQKPKRDDAGNELPKGPMPLWTFPSDVWTPMDHANVGKAFKRVLKDAGLPLHHSPHDLRHTFASLLLQQGESVQYVQRMLGHASITLTVDTYGKWLPMGNKAAVDRLDDVDLVDDEPTGGNVVAEATSGLPIDAELIDLIGEPIWP